MADYSTHITREDVRSGKLAGGLVGFIIGMIVGGLGKWLVSLVF